ncbi:hypothetical protein N431DRAFT_441902 [Stipitochalara longipes BDJ]|nr:hypothetical protein N431DRAFT_441902 [Stipitochalara longipes BDJ]
MCQHASEAVKRSNFVRQIAIPWVVLLPSNDFTECVAILGAIIFEDDPIDVGNQGNEDKRKLRVEVDPLTHGSVIEEKSEFQDICKLPLNSRSLGCWRKKRQWSMETNLPGGDSKAADRSLGRAFKPTIRNGRRIPTRRNQTSIVQAVGMNTDDGGVQIVEDGVMKSRIGERQDARVEKRAIGQVEWVYHWFAAIGTWPTACLPCREFRKAVDESTQKHRDEEEEQELAKTTTGQERSSASGLEKSKVPLNLFAMQRYIVSRSVFTSSNR